MRAQEPDAFVPWTYYVRPGDTVWAIAMRLGVRNGHKGIIADNRLENPDRLALGQKLTIHAAAHKVVGLPRPFAYPIEAAQSCQVTTYALPTHHDQNSYSPCNKRACQSGTNGTTVCQCWGDEPAVVLYENGRETVRVRGVSSGWPNIQAGEIDLDGDGKTELVAAVHQTSSNGIGLMHYRVVIFDGAARSTYISFDSISWGSAAVPMQGDPKDHEAQPFFGLFLRRGHATDRHCAVSPQSFEGFRDQVLGQGSYMAQRLFSYRSGALHPGPSLDVRVERLHPAARLERWPHEAHHWCEEASTNAAVTIESFDVADPDTIQARIRGTKAGDKARVVHVSHFLDGCTGQRFPENYRPANIRAFRGAAAQYCATAKDRSSYPLMLACRGQASLHP